MLVVNSNTKRHRRPNVRLTQVGDDDDDDAAAAFACGFSHSHSHNSIRETFANKRLKKPEFVFPNETQFHTRDQLDHLVVFADSQQNIENNNPNDMKLGFELANLDEINVNKPNIDFGDLTRETRVMKKRQTPRGNNSRSAWFSKLNPDFRSVDGKSCREEEFDDLSDHETSGRSKNADEFCANEQIYDSWKLDDYDYGWKEDTCDEGNTNEVGVGGCDINSVRLWLNEQGFGKYADLFAMHEVDEEVLPLLTIEDLKDIGVFVVGPRRKLYSDIQRLNRTEGSL